MRVAAAEGMPLGKVAKAVALGLAIRLGRRLWVSLGGRRAVFPLE